METKKFAFVIHPLYVKDDLARQFPWMKFLPIPESMLEWGMKFISPRVVSHIEGPVSKNGSMAEGWFIGVYLSPRQMLKNRRYACAKILEAVQLAEDMGAQIVGLGAITSVVTHQGLVLAKEASIPITTGHNYTVGTGIESVEKAARIMGLDLSQATLAIVGASGSIGSSCSRLLIDKVKRIFLIARGLSRLQILKNELEESSRGARIEIFTDIEPASRADVIITATSSPKAMITADLLKPGAIVIDISRPRNVSQEVIRQRNDVLIIDGGLIRVPNIDFHFDFGAGSSNEAYACMAETMILALEKRFENFSIGPNCEIEKIIEISELAKKHGFHLNTFQSFGQSITEAKIKKIRERAKALGAHLN